MKCGLELSADSFPSIVEVNEVWSAVLAAGKEVSQEDKEAANLSSVPP